MTYDPRKDFFVDGDIKHMYEVNRLPYDSSTYFYYPFELTITRIFKAHDVEPARRIYVRIDDIYELVLSRYHFWGLTVWINPVRHESGSESKPVVEFGSISHTPYVIVDNPVCRGRRIVKKEQLRWSDKIEWKMAKMFFRPERHHRIRDPKDYPATGTHKPETREAGWKFDDEAILSDSAEVLLIGSDKDIECIFNKLRGTSEHINESSLKDFLEKVRES
jgi:hypothetical protein